MTWVFVGATEREYLDRLERARSLDPDAGDAASFRASTEEDCIVGTPERAVERLRAYEAAGVQRIFLNHSLYTDIDMLELVAADVLPAVRT
jgi:alkanesulfonate monooxygenase SsuD/methylene tetrahydromethanopterin reductase-like flavin-dependent oxidoreductase (luciferase family)